MRGLSTAREAGGAHQSQVSVAQELAKSGPSFLHLDRRFARRPASTNVLRYAHCPKMARLNSLSMTCRSPVANGVGAWEASAALPP